MKLLIVLLMLLSSGVHSLDINFPEYDPKYIQEENAWKFGIKTSRYEIEDTIYFSIEINEKLLCPVERVIGVVFNESEYGKDLGTTKVGNTYAIEFENMNSVQVQFNILCSERSKIHKKRFYIYKVWESENA